MQIVSKPKQQKILITHLPLDKDKEEVFALVRRDRVFINSICEYAKELRKKGIKVYERKVNIIRTNAGYFMAWDEQYLKEHISEPKKKLDTFIGLDGRVKVKSQKGDDIIVDDLAKMTATLFVPNPNNFEYVKHKDENVNNNTIENLYWSGIK